MAPAKASLMPHAIWKGNIAFGLVNIPISLYSGESRPDIQLHLVDSRNHARVRYERVNAETGEEVPWDAMVKGYEYEEGRYVLLTQDELEAVVPKLTKTIQIDDFVDLSEIDPILFDKPYMLEPGKRGHKAYALLRETLRRTGRAGIAKVVDLLDCLQRSVQGTATAKAATTTPPQKAKEKPAAKPAKQASKKHAAKKTAARKTGRPSA